MKVPSKTARYAAKVTSRERGIEVVIESTEAKAGAAIRAGAMEAMALGTSIFMLRAAALIKVRAAPGGMSVGEIL